MAIQDQWADVYRAALDCFATLAMTVLTRTKPLMV